MIFNKKKANENIKDDILYFVFIIVFYIILLISNVNWWINIFQSTIDVCTIISNIIFSMLLLYVFFKFIKILKK